MAFNNSTSMPALPPGIQSRDLYIVCTLYGLIALLSILGNGFVLLSFFKSSKVRRSRTNYLIVSLSGADFVTGAVCIPLYTYLLLINFKGYNTSAFFFLYQFTDVFSTTASVWHLACVSLERYFAIIWPVVHHIATSTTYFVVMATLWIVSLASGGISLEFYKEREKFMIYNLTFLFGIPLLIIVFSYVAILRTTIRRSYVTSRKTFEQELKVSFTIFILIVLFIICWCPFFVLAVVSAYCGLECVTITMVIYFKALHFAASCVNPVVYAARIPDFRAAFTKILPKQIISFIFCLFRSHRRESPPNSRSRASSTLSSSVAMSNSTKDSRRRPTLLENKAASEKLTVSHEPPISNSVTSNKCVSFLSDSPSSVAGSQLTKF